MISDKIDKALKDKGIVTTPQKLPLLFENWEGSAAKAVRQAMLLSREYNLVAKDTPLRTIWYDFIKKILYNMIEKTPNDKKQERPFFDNLAKFIKKSGFYYRDFNILNEPAAFKIANGVRIFPNTLLAIEKVDYYGVFERFSDLLGIHLYGGGGEPRLSQTERVALSLLNDRSEDLDIITISDYDPAGFDIANTFYEHFQMYYERDGLNTTSRRIGPNPIHYTKEELKEAKYFPVKKSTHKRWNESERILERKNANLKISEGMETESLPAIPFSEQMPKNMEPEEAIGRARLKLLTFDALIEKCDQVRLLEKWMSSTFFTYPYDHAESEIDSACGISEIDSKINQITSKLNNISYLLARPLKTKKEELSEKYDSWREEQIEEWTKNGGKSEMFMDKLREAVARDYDQNDFRYKINKNYPKIPKLLEDDDWINEHQERIEKHSKLLDRIKNVIDEAWNKIYEELKNEEEEDTYW